MNVANPISIRRAGREDAAALAALGAATFMETFGHLYSREDLTAFLDSAHSQDAYAGLLGDDRIAAWLAEPPATAPAGYAVAGPCKLPVPGLEPAAGEIRQLYLRSAYHRKGLGTRLLVTALEWLDARKYAPLYVGVWSENIGAQRLYARHGFQKIGEYDFPVGRHLDREFIFRRTAGGYRASDARQRTPLLS